MATYINNNVKFHAFSKSPVSPDTTLGGAVNPSGHTITTSQVRAQDIPAFLNTFAGSRGDAITWLGKNYATPAHNDIAYYGGEFKAGFDTPKCLKYNGKTSTWEDFDLKYEDRQNKVLRTTLKNADDKDVLAIHQDCSTVFVDGGNNAATNSNRWSLFVKKADGSILDHFVASTDKIVAGMPSLGYNALVMLNNAAIDEGELDANYVGNTFAGIIHLNKQYANGDDAKFKVTCFEYIGDKLDTTLGNIREEIQDIVGVTIEGVVASVGTNDAATNAGIGVDSTTKTSPKITFTAGSVATGETKLVSGGAVKTYVDTTALAEGGSIAKAIATAKDEAIANAKVTLTAGNGITIPNSGKQDTAFTVSVDTDVIATKKSVDDLSDLVSGVSQTVAGIQTELSTGTIAIAISEAKAAAKAAQDTADAKVASVSGPATGLVTVTGDKDVVITVSDTIATKTDAATAASTAITTSLAGTTTGTIGGAITSAVSGLETKLTTGEGSLGSKVTALEGSVKTINETTIPNAITTAQNGAVATVKALTLNASDSDDAAKVTVTLGGTVETPTITVTSSDIASAQSLSELSSKVNTHIEEAAGLYLSVEKVDALPADAEAKTNKIYLVPVDTEEGREQNIHTEYIWTNGQWEVIGTTAIDMNSLEAAAEAAQAAADKAQGEVDAVEAAIAEMDADLTVNGISVKQVDGKVTELTDALITASIPTGATSVEGNVAYVGSTKHVIAPEKFQTAAQMPATLTSWVADLSNLTVGDNMFKGTALTTFIGDLDSLTSGVDMFNGCTLDAESLEILADTLPTVTSGTIDFGASTNATADVIATIKGKGWTLKSNGADVA